MLFLDNELSLLEVYLRWKNNNYSVKIKGQFNCDGFEIWDLSHLCGFHSWILMNRMDISQLTYRLIYNRSTNYIYVYGIKLSMVTSLFKKLSNHVLWDLPWKCVFSLVSILAYKHLSTTSEFWHSRNYSETGHLANDIS